jgi:hypothetical protein
MGFDWKLVQFVINQLSITSRHTVLDPFCGAGTTLVQCKKQGINSVGVDANPICVLASQVKTSWNLHPPRLRALLENVLHTAERRESSPELADDLSLRYLRESGMIDRGWLSLHKAKKVVALRSAIEHVTMKVAERNFFNVALISAIVGRIADIKFGPEVYCLSTPKRTRVRDSFISFADTMISDVESARGFAPVGGSSVVLGDSRKADVLRAAVPGGADYIITSPPYPAEHDYTRSTRLELIMLGHLRAANDLRVLKERMVRCHTKGIYKHDAEARCANRYSIVRKVSQELDRRAKGRTDGFSRLYGRMVGEYFGGMIAHLRSSIGALRPGGHCAYVIRDQQSLLGLYIDTPAIFSKIATSRSQGFRLVDTIEWRTARGSTGTRTLSEKIMIFEKPKY